jgi:hypothetical protein
LPFADGRPSDQLHCDPESSAGLSQPCEFSGTTSEVTKAFYFYINEALLSFICKNGNSFSLPLGKWHLRADYFVSNREVCVKTTRCPDLCTFSHSFLDFCTEEKWSGVKCIGT